MNRHAIHRAEKIASTYLTILRNPAITTDELCQAFGTGIRTFQRRIASLRACGVLLQEEVQRDGGHSYPSRWYALPLRDILPFKGEPVLVRWLTAMRDGVVDLTGLSESEKIQWYREAVKLMLVGTPPWSPSDHVDVAVSQGTLRVTVPKGRSVNHPDFTVYKEPLYGV